MEVESGLFLVMLVDVEEDLGAMGEIVEAMAVGGVVTGVAACCWSWGGVFGLLHLASGRGAA